MSEPAESPLALRIEAWLTPWRRARAPTVSPERTVTRAVLMAGAAAARAARTALAETRRRWPGWITDARRRPLAASRPDSDVPSRSAIAPTVSPGRTVYDVQRSASARAACRATDSVRGTDRCWPSRR